MYVTSIDRFAPRPGTLLRWTIEAAHPGVPSDVPPSFNQLNHLSDTEDGTTWLAATFDVEGRVDAGALAAAFTRLIDAHGSLRTGFVVGHAGFERIVHARGSLVPVRAADVDLSESAVARDELWSALDGACDPFAFPSYLLAAIDRADRSTVICGFDHAHVDAMSLALVIEEMRREYQRATTGADGPDAEVAADLDVGCFVEYCASEASAATVEIDDPRMQRWLAFLHRHHDAPPTFPLDLGVSGGGVDRSAVDVLPMLTLDRATRFEARCRAEGASLYAGILAAMAHAVRTLGGGDELSLLFPLHTRSTPQWSSAVGWFVTNAPLDVRSGPDVVDTIRRTGRDLRAAVELGAVPIPQVIEALGGLRRVRKDVFMVSYVDYRRLPGHADHHRIAAHHISNVTVADDAQFWISRTESGVALRARFPENPVARASIASFCREVAAIIDDVLVESTDTIDAALVQ